jgi:hypothetical protein
MLHRELVKILERIHCSLPIYHLNRNQRIISRNMDTLFCNTVNGPHTGKDGGGGKTFKKEHI